MMKKASIFVVLGLCLLSFDVSARMARAPEAASAWKAVGPQGGSIRALAFSEQDKNEIYAAVGPSVYQTKNGGSTWKRTIVAGETLLDVVPDAGSSWYLSLLSNKYLYRYRGTERWLKKDFPRNTAPGYGPLVPDPKSDEVFHIAGSVYEGGVRKMAYLKTLDGGFNWKTRVVASFKQYAVLDEIAVCPMNPAVILVAGWGDTGAFLPVYKIYRSVDGGTSWADKSGPIKPEAKDILFHPTNKNKAYVATTSSIWRSADGGATWKANNGEAGGYCLAVDAAKPNTVYAGHNKKLYKSADGGVSWKATPEGFTGICQALLVSGPTVYAGTMTGLFRSLNGGATWAPRQKGINAGQAYAVAVAPSSPSIVYAALRYDGLYKSQDSGRTWTRLPSFTNWEYISQILVSPVDPAKVLLLVGNLGAVPDTLYRSSDGGQTWTSIFAGNMERIAARGDNFERLFGTGQVNEGASWFLGIHASLDGGATWTSRKISNEPGTIGTAVVFARSDERILFIGGGLGYSPRLFKSSDGGTSWQDLSRRVATDMGISALAVDPLAPNIVYLGAWGLFRSEDGGLTWVKKVKNSPAYAIFIHPTVPGAIYAGFMDGCRRSLDGGLTWQNFKEGLNCPYVRWLDLDSTNGFLYAATAGGSISKRQL